MAGTGYGVQAAYLLTDRSDCLIVCHMGNYYSQHLDRTFAALRDPTRRAMLARRVAALTISLIAFAAVGAARAGADKDPYVSMAPIEHYLMANQADEIAQARSAAPPSISDDAGVLTLDSHGYKIAVKGKNGFVCLVQRAWFSGLDDTEFWNPKLRAPICFNQQGARSVLPTFLKRTNWVLAGATKAQLIDRTKAALAANEIPAPEVGTITYMMAKNAYLGDRAAGPWHPHLMFFLPRIDVAEWGANVPGSPVMGAEGATEPWTIFFVPVANWSDGTPDAHPVH
jgi:hypothetical protein